jgi:hypothetical protein
MTMAGQQEKENMTNKELQEMRAKAEKLHYVRLIIEQVIVGTITERRAVSRVRHFIWGNDPLGQQMKDVIDNWLVEDVERYNQKLPRR